MAKNSDWIFSQNSPICNHINSKINNNLVLNFRLIRHLICFKIVYERPLMLIFFFLFSAFFPLLVILHFIQLFFYSILISQPWFIATLFGNLLWLIAIGYYLYITFLGYHSLHILDRTKIFLYPFVPLVIIFLGSLIANWNITQSLMNFYHFRVLWKLNCIRVKWLSKKKENISRKLHCSQYRQISISERSGSVLKSFLNRDSYLFQTEETSWKSY